MKYVFLLITLLTLQIGATEDQNVGKPDNPASGAHRPLQTDFHTLLGCIKISNENYEKCNKQLIDIINTLTISPKASELLKKLERMHGTVELCFPIETRTGAHWSKSTRTICIELRLTNNIGKFCAYLIWELCNAGNEHLEIPLSLIRICGNQDTYAFLQESAEYLSVIKRNEILKDYFDKAEGIKELKEALEHESKSEMSITDISDAFSTQYENFKEYWTVSNRKDRGRPVHADLYRREYHIIINYCTAYGFDSYERGKSFRILTSWDQIGNDAQSLIVYAFSQQSFDIAKKEQRILRNTETDEPTQSREQNLADILQEKRMEQLIKLLMGLYIWQRR